MLSLIKAPVLEELKEFELLFDEVLTSENPLLQEVLAYIRQERGKMMRPTLIFLLARLLKDTNEGALYSAVSLELLHTASLVHDDVVDDSSERRGRLSVKAVFQNKVAILSGDYLLAEALLQASKTNSSAIIEIISNLGKDLAAGELLQLSNISEPEVSEQVYFDIIQKKTAALFATCAAASAFSVGVSSDQVEIARLFGEFIGICFQIRDDIFDYYEESEIGKPTGNDMKEGKLTLPAIFAIRKAGENAEIEALVARIKTGNASEEEIGRMIDFSVENGGIEYAEEKMMQFHGKALALLQPYPDSEVKRSLIAYADYVVARKK